MPKIVKIALRITAIFFGVLLLLLLAMQTHWFKHRITDRAISYLSSELNTEVKIDEVSIRYFDHFAAENLLIRDEAGDTLIFVRALELDYDFWTFKRNLFQVDRASIDGAVVNIGVRDSILNIRFLTDYFNRPSDKPKQLVTLQFKEIELSNTSFHYFNEGFSAPTSRSFNENDFTFSHIGAQLYDFEIIGDSLHFIAEDLAAIETSGLEIQRFSSVSTISRSKMAFEKSTLKTRASEAALDLSFTYRNYGSFTHFIDSVLISSEIRSSAIHTDEIALFNRSLKDFNEILSGAAMVKGVVSDLRCSNVDAVLGNHTSFVGSLGMKGLPQTDLTVWDLDADHFNSTASYLNSLLALNLNSQQVESLGNIAFKGSALGSLSDLRTAGNLETKSGAIELDITYRKDSIETYAAKASSSDFILGPLVGDTKLGSCGFTVDVSGAGLDIQKGNNEINAEIGHLDYDGYTYRNIAINGQTTKGVFDGEASIADLRYNAAYVGEIDLSHRRIIIDGDLNAKRLSLDQWGSLSGLREVKFNANLLLSFDKLTDVDGYVGFYDLVLNDYNIGQLSLKASTVFEQEIELQSDLIDAKLSGYFKFDEIVHLTQDIVHLIDPLVDSSNYSYEGLPREIIADIRVKEFHRVYQEFIPTLYLDSAIGKLHYKQVDNKLETKIDLYQPTLETTTTEHLAIEIKSNGFDQVGFIVSADGIWQRDSLLLDHVILNGTKDSTTYRFTANTSRGNILDVHLGGRLQVQNDSIVTYLDTSRFLLYETPWVLMRTPFPNIVYHNGITELFYFDLRHKQEILFFDASIGDNADKLNLHLLNFNLANFRPFMTGYDMEIDGLVKECYIDISDRMGHPIIESECNIQHLLLNGDTLGDLRFKSEQTGLLSVNLNGSIDNGLLNRMNINGSIDFEKPSSPLDLNLTTKKSSIKPFEKYLDGLASNVTGYSNTNIHVSGKLEAPKLKGTMKLDSLSFLVDYLQTNYHGSAVLDISYSKFGIRTASLYDRFNHRANVRGGVSHRNFVDYIFDITVDSLNNFELMNTQSDDNELFYGTAFVNGNMRVSGPVDDILLEINATSRAGTVIEIPLDNFETSGKLSYVEFVDLSKDNNSLRPMVNNTAGIQMDFNFKVTNDAKVILVFDELLGDKIEASGHGNIRMEINNFGDYNMYGGLTIDQGSYLFTAFDLINKYFTVKPGGTLFWDGNPYNATINLEAIKREYPVPSTLLLGVLSREELEQFSDPIPADCHLILKGLLFNPEVSFDLSFPRQVGIASSTQNGAFTTVMDRIKLDPEELNRQVFALMVLGTFIPPSFSTIGSGNAYSAKDKIVNTGWNSLSDLASNQLNNWLSQLDYKTQVGFDYNQYNGELQANQEQRDEFILSLRRKFLNDRLELAYSVDAGAADGARPYDFNVQYNLSKDGSFKVRGFQKNANDPALGSLNNITTTGVGFFYRYQFNRFFTRKNRDEEEDQ